MTQHKLSAVPRASVVLKAVPVTDQPVTNIIRTKQRGNKLESEVTWPTHYITVSSGTYGASMHTLAQSNHQLKAVEPSEPETAPRRRFTEWSDDQLADIFPTLENMWDHYTARLGKS